jgi:hypothetical protein
MSIFVFSQGVDHKAVEEEFVGKIELLWWFTYVVDPPNDVRTGERQAQNAVTVRLSGSAPVAHFRRRMISISLYVRSEGGRA